MRRREGSRPPPNRPSYGRPPLSSSPETSGTEDNGSTESSEDRSETESQTSTTESEDYSSPANISDGLPSNVEEVGRRRVPIAQSPSDASSETDQSLLEYPRIPQDLPEYPSTPLRHPSTITDPNAKMMTRKSSLGSLDESVEDIAPKPRLKESSLPSSTSERRKEYFAESKKRGTRRGARDVLHNTPAMMEKTSQVYEKWLDFGGVPVQTWMLRDELRGDLHIYRADGKAAEMKEEGHDLKEASKNLLLRKKNEAILEDCWRQELRTNQNTPR